ncbi:MAG: sulfurtransferase [Rhodothermales bacterium]|nr:sulfurtransferase [Rhodothermales bacterium]
MHATEYSNIAAYLFVDLDETWIREKRPVVREICVDLDLRGTILLSPEGTNVFLSGLPEAVREFWSFYAALPPFTDLTYKESFSDRHVYSRMLVKIKREIIAFGREEIRPAVSTSSRVRSNELKQWIDEGRELLLLDTRNDYEVELGSFRGAVDLKISNFRSFPEAAEQLNEEYRHTPVVTFCTGGIRCEKAAPFLETLGFTEVYQLDGGILQYLEECGGAYWEGECFVFDQRVAIDSQLRETDTEYCFRCQHILHPSDLSSPLYEIGVSCPFCATEHQAV